MPHPLRAGRRRLIATAATMLAAIAVAGCTPPPAPAADPAPPSTGVVVAVVDGDTIDVELAGVSQRVRVLGIDAPEVGRDGDVSECFAEESREVLNTLVYGQSVTLTADASQDDADRHGRLLRYVTVGDVDAGLAVLEAGAAAEYTYDVAYERQAPYRAAEAAAQSAAAGMWQLTCQ